MKYPVDRVTEIECGELDIGFELAMLPSQSIMKTEKSRAQKLLGAQKWDIIWNDQTLGLVLTRNDVNIRRQRNDWTNNFKYQLWKRYGEASQSALAVNDMMLFDFYFAMTNRVYEEIITDCMEARTNTPSAIRQREFKARINGPAVIHQSDYRLRSLPYNRCRNLRP